MVKSLVLVAVFAPTVTVILPVVVAGGTVATSCVVLPELREAVVPLNLTVLEASVELKFVPVMVTEVPTTPLVGEKLVMVGAVGGSGMVASVSAIWLELAATFPALSNGRTTK